MEKYTIFYRQENNSYQKFDFGSLRDYFLNSKLLTAEQKNNLSNFFNYTETNLLNGLEKEKSDMVIMPTEILEKYPEDILQNYIASKASGVEIIEKVNIEKVNSEDIKIIKLLKRLEITSACQTGAFYEFGFKKTQENEKIFNQLKELLKQNRFTNIVDNENRKDIIFFTNEEFFINVLKENIPETTVNACEVLRKLVGKEVNLELET